MTHRPFIPLKWWFCFMLAAQPAFSDDPSPTAHVWEVQEITFSAARTYANPYTDVVVWVQLEGPGFSKRVYGFWDGGSTFKVRVVATASGQWRWTSGSNQAFDAGLYGRSGSFTASPWSEAEKKVNANRRGFLRATANGHALQYADGTPFFLLGDTWLAASTWRLPFKGIAPLDNYVPGPGISFEEAVSFRKHQRFNSVSFIAAFPNWSTDHRASTFADRNGVFLRNAWEKFGYWSDDGRPAAKDMADERGERPFAVLADREGLADFDRINPAYFQSLDRKLRYLSEQGFVAMLEPVRRDACPAWKAYFDFNASYARSGSFGPDAWRTAANWSVDWSWWAADTRERELSDRIQAFFESKGIATFGNRWSLDGTTQCLSPKHYRGRFFRSWF